MSEDIQADEASEGPEVGGGSPHAGTNRFLRRLQQRETVRQDILHALKAAILTGELQDGHVYSMGELAEHFGASRTPVREALLELEKRGLVEIIRSVGFRVTGPTVQDLREMLDIRELLEVPTIARLAGRLSRQAVERARQLLRELQTAAAADDIPTFHELDRQFHVHLAAQSGNGRLARIIDELREIQWIPGLRDRRLAGQLTARNREHRLILKALESGDGDQAQRVLLEHLEFSRRAWGVETGG